MGEVKYIEAIREALAEEMESDPTVFLLGEDIAEHGGSFGVTRGLVDKFGPERVRNTPISEGTIISTAIGAAMVGMRPVAEIMFMDFITLAMDQLVNQAAKIHYMSGGNYRVPIVIRTPAGAGYKSIAAQHSQSLEAWFCHIPGLKVVAPSTPLDAKVLLKESIRDNNPVIFIEGKALYSTKDNRPAAGDEYKIEPGRAVVRKSGSDITLITYSYACIETMKAAIELEKKGISCEVIDLVTLSPLDIDTVFKSVRKTGRAAIIHEACQNCGLGGEIAARITDGMFFYLDAPILRIGGLDVPVPFSRTEEEKAIIRKKDIVTRISALF